MYSDAVSRDCGKGKWGLKYFVAAPSVPDGRFRNLSAVPESSLKTIYAHDSLKCRSGCPKCGRRPGILCWPHGQINGGLVSRIYSNGVQIVQIRFIMDWSGLRSRKEINFTSSRFSRMPLCLPVRYIPSGMRLTGNSQNLFGIFRETCQVYFLTAPYRL